jgi:Rps23 Pro-64 3,4-dihydroxylase Tpa1-like proline 4-hydroxylase
LAVSGTEKKKAAAAGKKVGESEEQLYAIIEELKQDLQTRDSEYEDLRKKLDKMTEQNAALRKDLAKEKLSSITVLAKLSMINNVKEIDANFTVIQNGKFFEKHSSKMS